MHIVYVCSPDRKFQLFTSLRSLFASGTVFERLTILVVGPVPSSWRKWNVKNVFIREVPHIGQDLWYLNKLHICSVEENGTLLHLDTDTIILKPLNPIDEMSSGDIVGRTTSYYEHPDWPDDDWKRYLAKYGAPDYFPYLNNGVIFFRNGVQQQLPEPWEKITRELLVDPDLPFAGRHHSQQFAFSLAAGQCGLSYGLLSSTQHAYGWEKNPYEDAMLYHTGNPNFLKYAVLLNRETGIFDKGPRVFHQPIEWYWRRFQLKRRLRGRWRQAKGVLKSLVSSRS